MKRRLKEETVIFISVFKWIVLATIIGIIVGFSTTAFVSSLNWGSRLVSGYPYYFLLMPMGLLASALIVEYLFPEARGHGADMVIKSVHKHAGKIKAIIVPVEFLTTFLTLTTGGSAGKEGPSAQIGGGLASVFADIFSFEGIDRRKLVICGISGGFASVFGTPIAGAIFGIEVLFVGSILYDVLLPSFVAGIVSYQVSSWLGLTYFYHPVSFVPVFSEAFFIKVIIAGVFFGVASFIFVEALRLGKKISGAIRLPVPVKAVASGLVLIALTLVFSTNYLGLGLDVIQSALEGKDVPWYAFLLKSAFTSITLSFGGSGGIGTPIFFVGATAGSAISGILGVDRAMLSAIGFVSLLAGAANTPIAASIMAVELFGAEVAPYAAIACVISFVITGHRSAYPSQVLAVKKSSSLEVELGEELKNVRPQYGFREKSVIGIFRGVIRGFRKKG
ncbi:MAG: chloride channel protein [Deltaproteobacteria bacterium]|nr:chloride channel protein [Deltaproteobacteria bacterium]